MMFCEEKYVGILLIYKILWFCSVGVEWIVDVWYINVKK